MQQSSISARTFKSRVLASISGAALAAGAALAITSPAHAIGTIILEGSDAIGYHCSTGSAGGCAYMNQTWNALRGSDIRPVAFVGETTFGLANIVAASDPGDIVTFADLSTAGALSQYSAVYFTANGGCCSSDPANISGRQADLTAYYNSGGTVQISDYDGNSGWDFLIGGSGHSSFVIGVGSDSEVVTALGLANGFTQPPVIGTWSHQAYEKAHFGALGFTFSFYDYGRDDRYSMLLSNGRTITGGGGFGVPEPGTWALMLIGFGGLGGMLRYRRRQEMAAA